MSAASTHTEEAIREGIQSQLALLPLDKIRGQPTIHNLFHLKQQCAKLCTAVRATEWKGSHGHLALVLDEAEMRLVTGDAAATVDLIAQPPIVPAGLTNGTTIVNRTKINLEHQKKWGNYYKQQSVISVVVQRIVSEAVESEYVEELDDEYLGYANQTIKSVLTHIRNNYCTVTTLDRKKAKADFNQLWSGSGHITKFDKQIKKKASWCKEVGVKIEDSDKVQVYVESMYSIDMFDDKEMNDWENKPAADKTYANALAYFIPM